MSEIKDKRERQRRYELSYNRLYRQYKKASPFMEKYNASDLQIPPSRFQFNGTDIDEPPICSHFGCSRKLSPTEALYSSKCVAHQNHRPTHT